jgi:anaerobic selenocysteine-containing dehydrogenase
VFCESQHRALRSLRKHAPHPEVALHPTAAQARGIADGDWVSIETPEASVRARARLNESLDPRVRRGRARLVAGLSRARLPGYDPFDRRRQPQPADRYCRTRSSQRHGGA